jgi:hypothetical protein
MMKLTVCLQSCAKVLVDSKLMEDGLQIMHMMKLTVGLQSCAKVLDDSKLMEDGLQIVWNRTLKNIVEESRIACVGFV